MDDEIRVLLKQLVPRFQNLASICDSPFTTAEDLPEIRECLVIGIMVLDTLEDAQKTITALTELRK